MVCRTVSLVRGTVIPDHISEASNEFQATQRCGVLDARNPLKPIERACQDKRNETFWSFYIPVSSDLNGFASHRVPVTRSFSISCSKLNCPALRDLVAAFVLTD